MIDKEELATLIPHEGKMFLLSRIVSWEPQGHALVAEYDIEEDCLFFKEALKGLPAWAGFELMAQSTSALSGLKRRAAGEKPLFGFILSVSELVLHVPVLQGTVRIEIEEDTVVDNVSSFQCSVFEGQIKAVSAKLTIMESADFSAVINR
ncbi:MAG: hypothetical protein FWG75_01465 [Cystobacterineae bacterium]|nr:hypothetical protein [Cystobacterineae bacterium]